MARLDGTMTVKRYDSSDMLGIMLNFPAQCEEAFEIGRSLPLPGEYRDVSKVVVTGMGGSAIGGDLLAAYCAARGAGVPVLTNRHYKLPSFVGEDTLVIAVSFSGNTEETLAAVRDALRRRAKVMAISSGGELVRLCWQRGIPVAVVPGRREVPAGMNPALPPRTAVGYLFVPALAALAELGLVPTFQRELAEAAKLLRTMTGELAPGTPTSRNVAKRIASLLVGRLPVIYSSCELLAPVALRWVTQLNENSKVLAHYALFPEMNHNEIVGWEHPEEILGRSVVVFLRDGKDHPRVALRMDITRELIRKECAEIIEVTSRGSGALARLFSVLYLGDFVSYYLALAQSVDPTPVDRITLLKKQLAEAKPKGKSAGAKGASEKSAKKPAKGRSRGGRSRQGK